MAKNRWTYPKDLKALSIGDIIPSRDWDFGKFNIWISERAAREQKTMNQIGEEVMTSRVGRWCGTQAESFTPNAEAQAMMKRAGWPLSLFDKRVRRDMVESSAFTEKAVAAMLAKPVCVNDVSERVVELDFLSAQIHSILPLNGALDQGDAFSLVEAIESNGGTSAEMIALTMGVLALMPRAEVRALLTAHAKRIAAMEVGEGE